MKLIYFFAALALCMAIPVKAQIGYQIALFSPATSEPRANETVSVTVTISDNAGNTICSETKSGTTNGAGILSLEIGNATTFSNIDWSKLPLWISAAVDNVTIGRTQILSVPVAEYSKHYGELTVNVLTSKVWKFRYEEDADYYYCTFRADGTGTSDWASGEFRYYIAGNTLIIIPTSRPNKAYMLHYIPEIGKLVFNDDSCPVM